MGIFKPAQIRKEIQQPNIFFDAWAGGNDIKDQRGNTRRLYHGTLSPFNEFSIGSGYPENYFGGNVIYTSSHPQDVASNYATEKGGDITSKIEELAERIPDEDVMEYANEHGIKLDLETNENKKINTRLKFLDVAKQMAKSQLNISNPRTIPVYGRMKNPVILSPKNSTTYDYQWDEETGEESGVASEIYHILVDLAEEWNIDGEKFARDIFSNLTDNMLDNQGITAFELNQAIRDSDFSYDIQTDDGYNAVGDFIAELFQRLGHDGIIQDAHHYFGKMKNVRPGVKHFIFFHPNQLKSAIGNIGYYNPNTNVLTAKIKGIFREAG